jgi:Cytochrome P450
MPTPLPVLRLVGCLPELRRDRLGFLLRTWREGGELVRVPAIRGRSLYVVTSPEIAREVLVTRTRQFKKFAALSDYSRPVLGDGLVTSEGDLHRRQRKLIAPRFGPRQIASYAGTMARHAAAMVDGWTPGRTLDMAAEVTKLTLNIATDTMFSTSSAEYARAASTAVHAASDYIAGEVGRLVHLPASWPLRRNRRLRRAVRALDEIVYAIVRERRARPGGHDDILQRLLDAQDEDDSRNMSDHQVRDEVMTLLVAGHETTGNALTWSLYLLARHPEVARRLAAQSEEVLDGRLPTFEDLPRLTVADQVFDEVMRLYPPAYMVGRESLEPVEIAGHTLPAGVTVLVSIFGLHRRPDLYPAPPAHGPCRSAPRPRAVVGRR